MAKKTENKEEVIQQTEQKIIKLFGNRETYNNYKTDLLKEIKKTKRENYFTLRCFVEKNTIQEQDIIIIQHLYDIVNFNDTIKQEYVDNITFAKKLHKKQNNLK